MRHPAIRLRPPTRLDRAWYSRLGLPAPVYVFPVGPFTALVRLLPPHWRAVHRVWTLLRGGYWAPCEKCAGGLGGHQAVVRSAAGNCWSARMLCPDCTREAFGTPRTASEVPLGVVLAGLVVGVGLGASVVLLLGYAILLGSTVAHGEPWSEVLAFAVGSVSFGVVTAGLAGLLIGMAERWSS